MRESGLPFEGRSATTLIKVSCGTSDVRRSLQASLARKASDAGSMKRVPLSEASGVIVSLSPVTSAPLTEMRCGAEAPASPSRLLSIA